MTIVTSVTSTILIILCNYIPTIVNSHADPFSICTACGIDSDCGDGGNPDLECVNDLCTWGDDVDHPPVCTSDLYCAVFDGHLFEADPDNPLRPNIIGPGCLRCCPYDDEREYACQETLSSGNDPCGIVTEFADPLATSAPCCPDETCLDNVAGICGVPRNESCNECIRWSYVVGDETFTNVLGDAGGSLIGSYYTLFEKGPGLQYRIFDNCGDGLTCWPDSTKPQVPKADHDVFGDLLSGVISGVISNIGRRRRLEENLRRNLQFLHGQDIIYEAGICIPADGQGIGTCELDGECPDCMRCCEGECMRILDGANCGAEGKGPCCCKTDICQFNECKTPTAGPTESPTTDSGDDDDDDDDDDDSSN